jgi:hypothetical protein
MSELEGTGLGDLLKLLNDRVADYLSHKSPKGNKAAARRVRKALQDAKNAAHTLRLEILAEMKQAKE